MYCNTYCLAYTVPVHQPEYSPGHKKPTPNPTKCLFLMSLCHFEGSPPTSQPIYYMATSKINIFYGLCNALENLMGHLYYFWPGS